MNYLHQVHVIMGYKSATLSEQFVEWVTLHQVHVIMGYKSATPCEQFVEWVTYIKFM